MFCCWQEHAGPVPLRLHGGTSQDDAGATQPRWRLLGTGLELLL